ncbi:unnamed protein product [Acidithrix sp. C25]|nr:unnamed protein product [Acidithrix sp. C25]
MFTDVCRPGTHDQKVKCTTPADVVGAEVLLLDAVEPQAAANVATDKPKAMPLLLRLKNREIEP